jgi:hypothetical protein
LYHIVCICWWMWLFVGIMHGMNNIKTMDITLQNVTYIHGYNPTKCYKPVKIIL